MRSGFCRAACLCAPLAFAFELSCPAQELPNLPPLAPEERALRDNPAAPGSAAMILYYAVDTDNTKSTETQSFRIKILTDEGKKYANIEIPYYEKYSRVEELRARTIQPDGTVVDSTDPVYDREIIKSRRVRVSAKTMALANVQVGTIIEYTYRLHSQEHIPDAFEHPPSLYLMRSYTYPAAEWYVQHNLFVRHGHFTLHPVKNASIHQHKVRLSADIRAVEGTYQLDVDNVPAYVEEEYSPPESTLKSRMDLMYTLGFTSADEYWKEAARRRATEVDAYTKSSKALTNEVAKVISPGDPDDLKLRKLYARAQQIRELSFEGQKSEKEKKEENLKENRNAEDILKHGYASGNEANLFFVALARAAGFRAQAVWVTSRDQAFFMKDYPNERQLNTLVAATYLRDQRILLDPAMPFCPFGSLPWDASDAGGILIDGFNPDIGRTPAMKSGDAVVRREATLRLSEDGTLSGTLKASYSGQEALSLRLDALRQDELARGKALEDSVRSELAQGGSAKLLSTKGWEAASAPLEAEFEIEVPGFTTRAGSSIILPLNVFHASVKNPFASARREHPVYFGYPHESYEDVRIELPPAMDVQSLPKNQKTDLGATYFELAVQQDAKAVHLTRTFRISANSFALKDYLALRGFYDQVLQGDGQQAVLRATPARAAGTP